MLMIKKQDEDLFVSKISCIICVYIYKVYCWFKFVEWSKSTQYCCQRSWNSLLISQSGKHISSSYVMYFKHPHASCETKLGSQRSNEEKWIIHLIFLKVFVTSYIHTQKKVFVIPLDNSKTHDTLVINDFGLNNFYVHLKKLFLFPCYYF